MCAWYIDQMDQHMYMYLMYSHIYIHNFTHFIFSSSIRDTGRPVQSYGEARPKLKIAIPKLKIGLELSSPQPPNKKICFFPRKEALCLASLWQIFDFHM